MSSISPQSKHFLILAENKSKLSRIALFHLKTRVCLKGFLDDCLRKKFSASKLPQATSKFIFGTILVTIRLFTDFKLKIGETNLQKRTKFCLSWITTLPIFSLSELHIRFLKTSKFG